MLQARAISSPTFRSRWLLLLGLLAFFGAMGVQYLKKIHDPDRITRSAILRWRDQILDLGQGENIWAKYIYPNPPIMALILFPIASLPPLWTSLSWFALKVLMTVWAIHWVFTMVEEKDRPFPIWGKILAFFLSLRPIQGDLIHGNVNLFILFVLAGSLAAFVRRREMLSGLLLALAIACKLTPALFVPYFLWKRAWKTLLGCLAGLVLFLFLVPGLFLGMARNAEYLYCWVDNMIVPFVLKGEVTPEHNNQSLPGLAHRLLTESPSFSDFDENNEKISTEYHNFASLDPRSVQWLLKACMALFAMLVIWCCRTPIEPRHQSDRGGNWRLSAEFGLIVLGMLLFSERTWKHHCVVLVIPFTVIAYYLSACMPARPKQWFLLGMLLATVFLMASTSTGFWDKGLEYADKPGKVAQVYGAYVGAYLILIAALVVLLKPEQTHGKSLR